MPNLTKLDPFPAGDRVHVVIETPKHARVKLKYEPTLRVFAYDRALPAGLAYPYDWGFVPATIGEDGDPLDGMVIHTDATFPGTVFACRVIGVLRVEQTENGKTIRNDRFFFCPADKRADKAPRELSGRQRRDLEQFFGASVLDTGKILKFGGWRDGETALASLRLGAKTFEHRAAKR